MMPSASPRTVIASRRPGRISWDTSAVEMSVAISCSWTTLAVTVFWFLAASTTARSVIRSASNLVDEGSLVPAVTTTSLKFSATQPPTQDLELPEFPVVEPSRHCASDAPRVLPADPALHSAAGRRQRQPHAAPVSRVGAPRDEAAFGQPVHQAGQGRLTEQHMPVQLANAKRLLTLGP